LLSNIQFAKEYSFDADQTAVQAGADDFSQEARTTPGTTSPFAPLRVMIVSVTLRRDGIEPHNSLIDSLIHSNY
jgi:hypothetical protein